MMLTIKRLKKLSPYKIYYRDLQWAGCFAYCKEILLQPFIEIDNALPRELRYATLLHELAHARHYKRNCRCYREDNRALKEFHAERFTFRYLLRYKYTKALKLAYEQTLETWPTYDEDYNKAFRMLEKDKIWKKVQNYLTSNRR